MKNTKKLLVGVLSVAALLGTGVAAWTIGGGLTNDSKGVEPTVVTDVKTRDLALSITAVDEKIVFDSEADLSVDYKVKAIKGAQAADDFDPYNLDNYKKVAAEYEPDLTVSVKAIDATTSKELDKNDPFFTYVKLPKAKEIHYEEWLDAQYKDKGYPVKIELEWVKLDEKYDGPQDYIDANPEAWEQKKQREWINSVVTDLQNVNFQFLFQVKGVKGEDVPPVEEETGTVTLPEVAGSTLRIDGYDPEKGTVTAGTHTITITTEEGKIVKDNTLTVVENGKNKPPVELTESGVARATTHTYTATYNFVAGATYSFKYEVVDETPDEPDPVTYKVAVEENENGTITVTDEAGEPIGETVNEGAKINVNVKANEGFKIDTVTVGEDAQTVNNSTFEKEYTVTSDLTISAVYSEISTEPEYEEFQAGKLGLYQQKLKKAYYFDGTITNDRFLGTTDVFEDAVKITSYKSNENYYLSFIDSNDDVKYLAAGLNDNGDTAFFIQDEAFIWSYNQEYDTYVATIDKKGDYYIGTYGTYNTFSLSGTYRFGGEGNLVANIVSEEIVVELKGIKIEASSYEIQEGLTTTLKSTLDPTYAPGEVTYEVVPNSGEGEVSIDDNVVTGIKAGKVQIVGRSGDIVSEPITITVTPKSETPAEVNYEYKFNTSEGFMEDGGNITLGDINWDYDKSGFFGYQTTYGGLQIGSKNSVQTEPWKITTKLPDGAIITDYKVGVKAGGDNASYKIASDALGETILKEGKYNKGSSTMTYAEESGVEYRATNFTIILQAQTQALYLCSISFTYYVA